MSTVPSGNDVEEGMTGSNIYEENGNLRFLALYLFIATLS